MAATTGQGTTLTFESGLEFELTKITPYSKSWESLDTTHLETEDAMTFMPAALPDNGSLSIEGHYDPDQDEPEDNTPETVTITFASGQTRSFTAFWTAFTPDVPVNDRMTFSGELKITGAISGVSGS